MASPHESILDAFKTRLEALAATQGGVEGVYRRQEFSEDWLSNMTFPCWVYGPVGTETILGATGLLEQIGYPVQVRIVRRLPVSDPDGIPQLLAWRKAIRGEFHRKPVVVAGLSALQGEEAYAALFQPSAMSEPQAGAYQLHSSPLLFQVGVFEVRP